MKTNSYLNVFVVFYACLLLAGCSVGMAMSGKPAPELGSVKVGASRGEIELHLGNPVEIRQIDGKHVDVYEYEIGNETSAGRAIGHGIMDILTLGLWEIVGTPVEGLQGEKKRLIITYDENDRVTNIGSIALPSVPTTSSPTSENPPSNITTSSPTSENP